MSDHEDQGNAACLLEQHADVARALYHGTDLPAELESVVSPEMRELLERIRAERIFAEERERIINSRPETD